VSRDRYHLMFSSLPDDAYVRSVRIGNQEVADKGLDLTEAPSAVQVEVVLSTKSATVEGRVTDDEKPAPGKYVVLMPDPPRPEQQYLIKFGSSDQNGRLTIKGIAPGDYKLYAFEELEFDTQEPESLKPFESKAVKLTVREGDRTQVELALLKPEDTQ